jgi:hypothetical protein
MEFIHAKYLHADSDFPEKETFILGKSLDIGTEKNCCFWLSPLILKDSNETSTWLEYINDVSPVWYSGRKKKYTLLPTANLLHIDSMEKYIGLFARYSKIGFVSHARSPDFKYRQKYDDDINTLYGFIEEIRVKACIMQKEVDDIIPDPYPSIEFVRDERDKLLSFTRKKKFSYKKAIAQIKDLIIFTEKSKNDFLERSSCTVVRSYFNGLSFDKIRDAGYDGIYFHQSAIDESNEFVKNNSTPFDDYLYNIKYEVESICVWNWVFE